MEVCLVSSNAVADDAILSVRAGAERKQCPMSRTRPLYFRETEDTAAGFKVEVLQRVAGGCFVLKPPQSQQGNFLIDNSDLQSPTDLLEFRSSRNLDHTVDNKGAAWGTIVQGIDNGDGWLKVGAFYLPMKLRGVTVVRPAKEGAKQYRVAMSDGISCEFEVKGREGKLVEPPSPSSATEPLAKTQDFKEYLARTGLLDYVQGVLQVVVKEQPEDPFELMARLFQDGYDEEPEVNTDDKP